jgi:biotin carboxylase
MRVLLIAATTGYQTRAFDDAARRLGVELVLATDRCHVLEDPWGDRAIAVRFDQPESSAEQIASAGRVDALIAVGDRQTVVAAQAARRLGIRYHPVAAVEACHDKHRARELYRAAGLPVPRFFRVALSDPVAEAAGGAPYPCVLKPLGLSASRGVIRANDQKEFVAAFARIRALLESAEIRQMREEQSGYIQVEEYLEGAEYALEGLLTEGKLKVLAIFDKPDPLDGPFFEETLYITPTRAPRECERALIEMTEKGARALGLTTGPVHAELRYNARGAWILEIAARPIGGLCARALRFGEGMSLEELILRHALGEDVSGLERTGGASGVMMIPIPKAGIYQGARGVEEAGRVEGIEEAILTAKAGQRLQRLPEGASYLGFLFARGDSPDRVESSLRRAHAELQFEIAEELPTLAKT